MSLQPHEQRVVTERKELSEKLTNLKSFIASEAFPNLPGEDSSLIRRQADLMDEYLDILHARISRFDQSPCPASLCPREVRRALLIVAPSHQGGHSRTGQVLSEVLGVRFPLEMVDLEARAKKMGFDPDDLWPRLRPTI